MRKLALRLDALCVESFATRDDATPDPGTVRAHAEASAAEAHTCGCPTQYHTCGCTQYRTCGCTNAMTCYNTCNCPSWSGPECGTVCVG